MDDVVDGTAEQAGDVGTDLTHHEVGFIYDGQHAAWLSELGELGFDQIHLHHVGQDLRPFIDAFGERVLPELLA